MNFSSTFEELRVQGAELVGKIRDLIHEGNVRRVIIKDSAGQTYMEIPVTVAAVASMALPLLAAIGALAALVADFRIVVERTAEPGASSASGAAETAPPPPSEPGSPS